MAIIAMNATKARPAERIKQLALGMEDQYGNPFEIIHLKWIQKRRNTEYSKTRGFEDTIIAMNPTGDLEISYRRPGSIQWVRPDGIGPYTAEVAKTPYNMRKLATMYGDQIWTINEKNVNAEVKAIYEKIVENMPMAEKQFNEHRIKSMNSTAYGNPLAMPKRKDNDELLEQKREVAIKEMELKEREAIIKEREEKIILDSVVKIRKGEAAIKYEEASLVDMEPEQLMQIAKDIGAFTGGSKKKEVLINSIRRKQAGEVKTPVESVAD